MTIEAIKAEMNRVLGMKRIAEDQKTKYHLLSNKIEKVNINLVNTRKFFLLSKQNISNGGFVINNQALGVDKIDEFLSILIKVEQDNKAVMQEINSKISTLTNTIKNLTAQYNTLNAQYQMML